jgi:hypothetical protein
MRTERVVIVGLPGCLVYRVWLESAVCGGRTGGKNLGMEFRGGVVTDFGADRVLGMISKMFEGGGEGDVGTPVVVRGSLGGILEVNSP